MKQIYYWLEHLFWLIGSMWLSFIELRWNDMMETYWWFRIHLLYKRKCIKRGRMTLDNYIITFIGFLIVSLIIYLIYKLTYEFIKICQW